MIRRHELSDAEWAFVEPLLPRSERARLAAGALAARVRAARRAERLGSRSRPYAVAVPAASRSHPRPFRAGREDGRFSEPEAGVDAVEQTRQTLEAAAAQVAATLQDSRRAREAAHSLRPQPTPATAPQPHTQQPGTHRAEPQEESREHPGRPAQPRRALARARAARKQDHDLRLEVGGPVAKVDGRAQEGRGMPGTLRKLITA